MNKTNNKRIKLKKNTGMQVHPLKFSNTLFYIKIYQHAKHVTLVCRRSLRVD